MQYTWNGQKSSKMWCLYVPIHVSWHIQWYKKCSNQWKNEQVMPFESEEVDMQKLNIIVQFVFWRLNSLYVVPLLWHSNKICTYFLDPFNGTKNCWNWWQIEQVMPFQSEEGDLQKLNIKIQFVFLNLNSLYIILSPLTFKKNL
jgi:hypothetical protein